MGAAVLEHPAPPVIDLQRRRRFRLPFWRDNQDAEGGEIDWADPGPDPAQAHEQRQQYQQRWDAMRTLPARQREAFTLRVLQDLDGATTARAMGCSEGAVKTHLARPGRRCRTTWRPTREPLPAFR